MEVWQWVIGILVVVLMAVMGFFSTQLWGHVVECRQLMMRLEGLSRDVERMKRDIGTHDDGLRGEVHRTSTMVTQHELRITNLERP